MIIPQFALKKRLNNPPEKINKKFSGYLKKDSSHILNGSEHRNKISQRVMNDLDRHHAALLLGPPGSGKTHLAKQIAGKRGNYFFGVYKNPKKWAKSHSTDGDKLTAIIDEATLALHQKHLDHLMDAVPTIGNL